MANRNTFLILIISLLAGYTSSTNNKLKIKTCEISRISFASGGCDGDCPKLAIEVDPSTPELWFV